MDGRRRWGLKVFYFLVMGRERERVRCCWLVEMVFGVGAREGAESWDGYMILLGGELAGLGELVFAMCVEGRGGQGEGWMKGGDC